MSTPGAAAAPALPRYTAAHADGGDDADAAAREPSLLDRGADVEVPADGGDLTAVAADLPTPTGLWLSTKHAAGGEHIT